MVSVFCLGCILQNALIIYRTYSLKSLVRRRILTGGIHQILNYQGTGEHLCANKVS